MSLFGEEALGTKRMLFQFKPKSARILTGEEDGNRICHVPGMGGVGVLRDSLYVYRYGHIFWPVRDELGASLQRDVTLSMWIRQDDPTPLSLAAGYSNGYQGARLTKEDQKRMRSNATRTAVAEHKRAGKYRDALTRLLMIILFITAVLAGLVWLSIPIIGFVKL